MIKLDRLKAQLQVTGLQQSSNALYQIISQLIDYLRQLQTSTNSDSGSGTVINPSVIREAGYWSPLIVSNNSASRLGIYTTDSELVGELVLTDSGDTIAVWTFTSP